MPTRAQDVPELRAELVQSLASPELGWFFEQRAKGRVYRGTPAATLQANEVNGLAHADLYYVSQPMSELAREAAKTLPRFEIEPEDVPSRSGLAYLGDGRFGAIDSIQPAAAFGWRDTGDGIAFTLYADTESMLAGLLASGGCTRQQAADHRRKVGQLSPMAFEAQVPYGLKEGTFADEGDDQYFLVSAFRSIWLLMQQPLSELSEAEASRGAQKRIRRLGREPGPVRVIELRRPRGTAGDGGESGREWQHQWIVRGHWRQQWYPARQVHRPVWIAPHVKGPEGAPMIGGEKVYAWKR